MQIETEHEQSVAPEPLRALEQLVGGEQQIAGVILGWYGCSMDTERLKRVRPDLPGEVIEEFIQAYQLLQVEVEDLLAWMIAASEDLRRSGSKER